MLATCGIDYYLLILNYKGINVELKIWDTEWLNSRLFNLQKRIYENADIVFLFYDSSSKETFNTIINKTYYFEDYCKKNTIFALIRNKYDNKYREEVSDEIALEFADKNNMLFFHLSLHEKNETGVKELFENVLNEYFKRKIKEKEKKEYELYY